MATRVRPSAIWRASRLGGGATSSLLRVRPGVLHRLHVPPRRWQLVYRCGHTLITASDRSSRTLSAAAGPPRKLVAVLNQDDIELEETQMPSHVRVVAVPNVTSADMVPDEIYQKADVLMVWRDPVLDAATLRRFRRLRAVVRIGVGVDSVDMVAAGSMGISVSNVPAYGTEEVADSTMSHVLNLYRRTSRMAAAVARGSHTSTVNADTAAAMASIGPVHRIRGQVLGLVGLGRIGTAVAHRAHAFGFDVRFFDPLAADGIERALGASWLTRCETFAQLLEVSDCVSLHCTLNPSTQHILSANELQNQLKHGAFVVNTARGGLIDDQALEDALRSGTVAAAGIDCLEGEPELSNTIASLSDSLPQLIVTPHSAFYSEESVEDMRTMAAAEAARALATCSSALALRNCQNLAALATEAQSERWL